MRHMLRFLLAEEGSSAIETGLMTSLIGLATIASITAVGDQLNAVYGSITLALAR